MDLLLQLHCAIYIFIYLKSYPTVIRVFYKRCCYLVTCYSLSIKKKKQIKVQQPGTTKFWHHFAWCPHENQFGYNSWSDKLLKPNPRPLLLIKRHNRDFLSSRCWNCFSIISPILEHDGDACIFFQYHMFGDEMGTLEVAIGNYTWRLTGNQGDAWRRTVVETTVTTGDRVTLTIAL